MLKGKTIVVTGAGGALGVAVRSSLQIHGARVIGIDLWPGEGIIAADLTQVEEVRRVSEEIETLAPDVSGLVLLAGGYRPGAARETGLLEMEELLRMNLHPAVEILRRLLPGMEDRGFGRIVAIGAYSVKKTSPRQAGYNASKAALQSFIESVAEEVKEKDIAAVTLLPTTLDTPANRAAMPKADPAKWVRLERMGEIVAFLMSDAAGDLNGASIPVRGRL